MLPSTNTRSLEFPRQKIYLENLNQLMDKKFVVQPEIEVSNKLFPQRDFAKRLSTSHQRTKSSIQLRSQRFDLHWTTKRAKNLLIENSKQAVVVQSNQVKLQLPRTKSTQLPNNGSKHFRDESIKFYSTCTGLPHNNSPQSQPTFSNPASPQKNFLRRGSNIQKQIVINLLRNKLIRQRQVNQKKEYSNSQIIKMIQVFKGVAIDEYNKKGLLTKDREISDKRRDIQREIRGWENEPFHEYQLHDQKQ